MEFAPFNWTCEYCGKATTITESNYSENSIKIDTDRSKYGNIGLRHIAISCPNADCKELTLSAHLQTVEQISFQEWRVEGDPIRTFSLMPRSRAKPQPEYIPKEIRENYREACLVLADSPKASAAMARRCLQGIVRDFWGIPTNKRGNLGAEMSFIKDRLTEDTWEAIHAVRSVGDIGAHMEKDVNSIVDIEPSEADLLVQLIETLFEDWYVERHKRQKRNQQLKDLAEKKVREKKEAKKATSTKEGG